MYSIVPTSVLRTWPAPNYVDPPTRGPEFYIVCGIFLGLATVLLFVRLYARLFVRRWFGLDDALIIFSWFTTIGNAATVAYAIKYFKWDRHIWDVPLDRVFTSMRPLLAACMFWVVSSTSTKLSLLCFYYRLVQHVQIRRYRWVLHVFVFIVIAFTIAYIVAFCFVCRPLSSILDFPSATYPVCFNIGGYMFACTVINTSLELIIALLPIPAAFHLQLDGRQRWSVVSVLCLGVFVAVIGCVRCYYVYVMAVATYDVTWWAEAHWICSQVEIDVSLMCACAPALRPVLGRLFGLQQNRDSIMYTDKDGFSTKGEVPHKAAKNKRNEISTHSTVILYDLEGIGAEDGLGYTVSISAANRNGRRHHHRGSHGFGFSGRRSSSRQHKLQLSSRSGTGARSTSRLQKHTGQSSYLSSSPRAHLSSVDSAPQDEPLEIVTRRTVEVRESFLDLDVVGHGAGAENSEQTGFAGALWRNRDAFGAGGPSGRGSGGSGSGGDERDAIGARRYSGGRRASASATPPPVRAPPSAVAEEDRDGADDVRVASRAEERGERVHAHHNRQQQQQQQQQRYSHQHLRTPSYPPTSRRSTMARAGAASPLGALNSPQAWAAGGGRVSSTGSRHQSGSSYYGGGGSAGSRSSSAAGLEHPSMAGTESTAEDTSWMLEIATMREILRWQRRDGSMYAEDGSLMSSSDHDRPRT